MAIEIPIDNTSIVQLRRELVGLRQELQKATDPKIQQQFQAEIEKVNKKILEQAEAYDASGKSFTTLRQEAKAFQDSLGEIEDSTSATFQTFARGAGQARDGMISINEQINKFAAGTVFEQAQLQLGGIREGLLSLDFDKVSESAANLSNTIAKAGSLKEVFGDIGGAVKNLGNVFVQIGKQLLANPLYLLAAVIGVLVVAVVAFMDKIGVLGKVMEAVAAPLKAFMKILTDITDALGISAVAQTELADATVAAGDRIREDIQRRKETELGFAKLSQDLSDESKKRLQEQFKIAIDFNKDELQIRKESNQELLDNANKSFASLADLRLKEGKLDEEREKTYQSLLTEIGKLEDERRLIIAESVARVDAAERGLSDQLTKLRAENVQGEANKNKALLQLEKQRLLDQITAQEKLTGNVELAAQLRSEIEILYANKVKEVEKKDSEARTQTAKQNAERGLQQLREVQELLILQTEEGSLKRFEAEKNAADKILEYQIENAKRLGLNETQVNILKEKALDEREKLERNYAEKQKSFDKKLLELQDELTLLSIKNAEERARKELEIQERKAIDEINATSFSEEEKQKLITAIQQKYQKIRENNETEAGAANTVKEKELIAQKEAREASAAAFDLEMFQGNLQGRLDAITNFQTQEKERIDAQRLLDLENAQNDEQAIADIEEQYRQDSARLELETLDAQRQARFQYFDDILQQASNGLNAIADLGNLVLDLESQNLEEGTKEAEVAAKKKFEFNKAFQLGAAVINGLQAVNASLAQSPIAIGPVPNPAGIASLAFAIATTTANIIKIASQQYKSKSTSVSGGPQPTAGSPIPQGGAVPALGLFPGQNVAPPIGGTTGPPPTTEITVKAVVVESEITETQSNIKKIQSASELGG